MICACGKVAEPGKAECFRCRVATVGITFRGGAHEGRSRFHTTKNEWLKRNLHVDSEKELARTRPDVERFYEPENAVDPR